MEGLKFVSLDLERQFVGAFEKVDIGFSLGEARLAITGD